MSELDDDADTGAASTNDADPDGADQLGDAGKRALDSMKGKWQSERDRRKALEDELAKLKADQQPTADPVKIREEARAEVRAAVLKERALDKIEARAARLFADPEDATVHLASKVDDFIRDGKVDTGAIAGALEDLLKRKPHLGIQPEKRFAGSADGGPRKGDEPQMLTRSDVERLFREGKHAEIDKARAEGRIKYEKKPTS